MKVNAMDDFSDQFKNMTQWQEQISNLTKGLSISISNSVAAMAANYIRSYTFPFEQINNQLKMWSQTIYSEIYDSINMTQMISVAIQKMTESYSITIRKSLESFYISSSITILQQIKDSQASFNEVNNLYQSLENYADITIFADEKDKVDLTDAEKKQVADAIEDIMDADPKSWIDRAKNKYQSLQEPHPLIAKAIVWLLSFVLTYFLTKAFDLAGEAITQAVLRDAPTPSSQSITIVQQKQQIFILDNQPYYYEIKFTDEQTGETYKGWISKRSVRPVN